MRGVTSISAFVAAMMLTACATRVATRAPETPPAPGKYYLDDGPPERAPESLEGTPDAVPRAEALHRFANRAYVVFGKQYVPLQASTPLREQGIASWYGRKFHGQKTAIGETYDLYAMTAAHPTAPLPSYAKVTNLENGRTAVVRINDRGPFLQGRIIDLSYAAAAKLGFARRGTARVEVELIVSGQPSVLQPMQGRVPPLPESTTSLIAADNSGDFYLQLGAFGNEANATSFLNQVTAIVSDALGQAPTLAAQGGVTRVRIGPYRSRDDVLAASATLIAKTGVSAVIGK